MFEALILTLREGLEAALVVGLVVVFLEQRRAPRGYFVTVGAGVGAAVVFGALGALLLFRLTVNQEALEGLLYLAAAVLVLSMVVWMWRHAGELAGRIKGRLSALIEQPERARTYLALFAFVTFMVLREALETMLFLAALTASRHSLRALVGAAIGLLLAIAFGVAFVRGSARVDLRRFFAITGVALLLFVAQLLINAYHELSEAGWLPANERTMAAVGPLVRNDFFFLLGVIGMPLLALLIRPREQSAAPDESDPAATRLLRAATRRAQRGRVAAGGLGIAALGILGLGFSYSRLPDQPAPAEALPVSSGEIRIALDRLPDGEPRHFSLALAHGSVRFMALRLGDQVTTALDACTICGARGFRSEGEAITCLHCGSAVYPPTIGQPGGCNPIPLESRVVGRELIIAAGAFPVHESN